jgi:flotillin
LQEMFNMAGMDLPEYLKGKDKKEIASEDAEIDKSGEK